MELGRGGLELHVGRKYLAVDSCRSCVGITEGSGHCKEQLSCLLSCVCLAAKSHCVYTQCR